MSSSPTLDPAVDHNQGPSAPTTRYVRIDAATPTFDPTPRPCQGRALTQHQLERLDVYGYESVKERRHIHVVGLHAAAVALSLEFDPKVTAFVERPRTLQVADQEHELHFWVRYRDGREQFLMLVPDAQTVVVPGGMRQARERVRLGDAARSAAISMRLVTEDETLRTGVRTASHLLLLPFVQIAQTLDNRLALRTRIIGVLEQTPRYRIAQLEQALSGYCPADVHAVLAELIYLGAVDMDCAAPISRGSLVWRARA